MTLAVAAQVNFGPDVAMTLKNRVRANLLYLAKVRELVVKEGDRDTVAWRRAK